LIQSTDQFTGHPTLVSLSLKQNKLQSALGLSNTAQLQELYLSHNQLVQFNELSNMPMLKKLDLNTNKIASLANMPNLPALEHLDLGANLLASADCLTALHAFPGLKVIIMSANPFVDEMADKFKSEVLVICGTHLKKIKTINEEEVADEEVVAAGEERNERAKLKREAEEEAIRVAAEKALEEAALAADKNKPAGDAEDE